MRHPSTNDEAAYTVVRLIKFAMNALLRNRRLSLLITLSLAVGVAALTQAGRLLFANSSAAMFLAPMIGVIEPCILLRNDSNPSVDNGLALTCTGPRGSAGALVESTLAGLATTPQPAYELGYTLPIPLLKLFKSTGGDWVVDHETVRRLTRTIHDVDRPTVVYLFSNHFGSDAPIEEALNADRQNLSITADGPLAKGTYYSTPIYNWNFASTRTAVTERRVQAAKAVLEEICKLDARDIAKIRGVTLLGEIHHLFPDFEGGMGFAGPYRVSDYSDISRRGFREYLKRQYGSIGHLNQAVGAQWLSFDEVEPPSKDIRTTPLRDFTEHIDSFAHGSLPVSGWTFVEANRSGAPSLIRIYRNGELIARTPVRLSRQDVLQHLPQLGNANTGWRYDMNFRSLASGLHTIDVMLEHGSGSLIHLASRQVAIMDRTQSTPAPMPRKPLPASSSNTPIVSGSVDLPADQSSYFYNPLVPLWHAFRGKQVVDYLEYFSDVVDQSCLSRTPRYTHQIIPFTNPSWDENKYAIGASLKPLKSIRLGVSLYGEPTYGTSFTDWLTASGQTRYGITEFHPLKSMTPADVRLMMERHARRGASFISFFLEPRWKGELVERGHNIFSLDPSNRKFGSDDLYESFRTTLRNGH